MAAGVFQFELTVTDNGGLSAKDTVQVTVVSLQQTAVCDLLNRDTIPVQITPELTIPTYSTNVTIGTTDNKLLLAGAGSSSNVDIYDFSTQIWSTAHLSLGRQTMISVTVGNKVFFAGGGSVANGYSTRLDIYDAAANNWSFSDLPRNPGNYVSAATVGNKVFFATNGNPKGTVDIYDKATNSWSAITLPVPRINTTATAAGTKVYFAGGTISVSRLSQSNDVDIYDTESRSWSTSSLSQPTSDMMSIYLDGKIYWAGGAIGYRRRIDDDSTTCKVEIRDVSTQSSSFTSLSEPAEFFIWRNSKPVYYNGKIVFCVWDHLDIYDPHSNHWSVGRLPQNMAIESMVLVNNALYALMNNTYNFGYTLSKQIWKLQY